MLAIKIICVGKLKEKFLTQAIEEYVKRLKAMCKCEIIELAEYKITDNPSNSEILRCKSKETETIMKKISEKDYVIAMCIEGEQLSSEDFAQKIEELTVNGVSTIAFIIGGSYGICDTVKNRANFKMSISKMTFPHQLFRVLLIEQIYRGFSIINKTKYHK